MMRNEQATTHPSHIAPAHWVWIAGGHVDDASTPTTTASNWLMGSMGVVRVLGQLDGMVGMKQKAQGH